MAAAAGSLAAMEVFELCSSFTPLRASRTRGLACPGRGRGGGLPDGRKEYARRPARVPVGVSVQSNRDGNGAAHAASSDDQRRASGSSSSSSSSSSPRGRAGKCEDSIGGGKPLLTEANHETVSAPPILLTAKLGDAWPPRPLRPPSAFTKVVPLQARTPPRPGLGPAGSRIIAVSTLSSPKALGSWPPQPPRPPSAFTKVLPLQARTPPRAPPRSQSIDNSNNQGSNSNTPNTSNGGPTSAGSSSSILAMPTSSSPKALDSWPPRPIRPPSAFTKVIPLQARTAPRTAPRSNSLDSGNGLSGTKKEGSSSSSGSGSSKVSGGGGGGHTGGGEANSHGGTSAKLEVNNKTLNNSPALATSSAINAWPPKPVRPPSAFIKASPIAARTPSRLPPRPLTAFIKPGHVFNNVRYFVRETQTPEVGFQPSPAPVPDVAAVVAQLATAERETAPPAVTLSAAVLLPSQPAAKVNVPTEEQTPQLEAEAAEPKTALVSITGEQAVGPSDTPTSTEGGEVKEKLVLALEKRIALLVEAMELRDSAERQQQKERQMQYIMLMLERAEAKQERAEERQLAVATQQLSEASQRVSLFTSLAIALNMEQQQQKMQFLMQQMEKAVNDQQQAQDKLSRLTEHFTTERQKRDQAIFQVQAAFTAGQQPSNEDLLAAGFMGTSMMLLGTNTTPAFPSH